MVVSRWMARNAVSCGHETKDRSVLFASVVRFPDRHDRNLGMVPVLPAGPSGLAVHIGFAVVMAQVRRPVPFRTRKLRPGRGDGTALERVWESSTPPHSFVGVPVERDAPGTPFCLSSGFRGIPGRDAPGTPFLIPAHGRFLRPLEVFGRRKDCRRDDSSIGWRFRDAGRPVGGRIAPVTGSPGTLGDPRNFRGASCPYPMVE